jgi:hypothetical protein
MEEKKFLEFIFEGKIKTIGNISFKELKTVLGGNIFEYKIENIKHSLTNEEEFEEFKKYIKNYTWFIQVDKLKSKENKNLIKKVYEINTTIYYEKNFKINWNFEVSNNWNIFKIFIFLIFILLILKISLFIKFTITGIIMIITLYQNQTQKYLKDLLNNTNHKSETEIEYFIDKVKESPKVDGKVILLLARGENFERTYHETFEISNKNGISNERWGNSKQMNRTGQISIMNARILRVISGSNERMGLAGDNIIVDFNLENIKPGQLISIGNTILKVTTKPHTVI